VSHLIQFFGGPGGKVGQLCGLGLGTISIFGASGVDGGGPCVDVGVIHGTDVENKCVCGLGYSSFVFYKNASAPLSKSDALHDVVTVFGDHESSQCLGEVVIQRQLVVVISSDVQGILFVSSIFGNPVHYETDRVVNV
jgi:hypothetical protein